MDAKSPVINELDALLQTLPEERAEAILKAAVTAAKANKYEDSTSDTEPLSEPKPPTPYCVPERPTPMLPPRLARVQKLRQMIDNCDTVGQKRKRGFNDYTWNDIKHAYQVNGKDLRFKPTPSKMQESIFRALMLQIEVIVSTSDSNIMTWNESIVSDVVSSVFRYVGYSMGNDVKVEPQDYLRNKELGMSGRADYVVAKDSREVIVVEVKRGDGQYNKGLAQMMLAAETMLAEKLKHNEDADECVYGLLSNNLLWTWMRLDREGGRFYHESVNVNNYVKDIASMAGIALGLLQDNPVDKTSQAVENTDKRARFC